MRLIPQIRPVEGINILYTIIINRASALAMCLTTLGQHLYHYSDHNQQKLQQITSLLTVEKKHCLLAD